MRTRVLTIISVGVTIGFLLGMSVISMLRALLDGESAPIEISFTIITGMMKNTPLAMVRPTASRENHSWGIFQ